MLLNRALLLAALLPVTAFAQRELTQEALSRFEESVSARVEDGALNAQELTPTIVVSVLPAFEETRTWYPTAATAALIRVFGSGALRSCEACMSPRLYVADGRMEQNFAGPTIAEIIRLDDNTRGTAPPAKTALWLEETAQGVSLRIVDLRNSRILLAENFDGALMEAARTKRNFSLTRELERRARGDSITHTFFDAALYPGQHFSLDWAEQWGDGNRNLSGVTLSLFDPILGIGGNYFRVIPQALNIMVGAKVILSVPVAIIQGVSPGASTAGFPDPLLTAVLMVRIPIASSNFGVIASASTNLRFGLGISFMNLSLLPVLP